MSIKISIDAHGGDHGIPVIIRAGIQSLKDFDDLYIYFVGDENSIKKELTKYADSNILADRFNIVHSSEIITMDDDISTAMRLKKNSSMRVAINLVKNGEADACVSAGNTGALMAISRFVLKTIEGIVRPAIMASIPTIKKYTHMLDLGADINSPPSALLQFAIMGSITIEHTENIKHPTIGLLNVGKEEIKGNEHIKKTSELLQNSSLNYVGFIEGDDIYKGSVDLVVCDGFIGNIALKASEGVVLMINHYLKKAFNKNIFSKGVYLASSVVLKDFKSKIDPNKYNGASLLGLKGIVIKSHGNADVFAFCQAIKKSHLEVQAGIINKISKQISLKLQNEAS